nr:hypothetical protein [Tanacetum cinerariifolium]
MVATPSPATVWIFFKIVSIDDEELEQANDDQAQEDQAEDDILGTLVTRSQKEKPETTTTTTPTPLPTPSITSEAPPVTTMIPDPLPTVIERLDDLKRKFNAWYKVDHSKLTYESIRSQVPPVVYEFLRSKDPDEEHVHDMSLDAEENIVDELGNADEQPDGDGCLFNLNKPLPLKGHPGYLTVAAEYFFKNDQEDLKSKDSERKYYIKSSITKTKVARSQLNRFLKHDVYSYLKILSVVSVKVNKLHGYGYLEEIMHRLFYLDGDVIVDLAMALRMFIRCLIIKKRVEDVQLGVESYQKKLNIIEPQKDFPTISAKKPYTPSFDPQRVIYEDLSNQMRLIDMLRRKCSALDQRHLGIMVDLIDKQLLKRQIIRNLERLEGAKEFEIDYGLMKRMVSFCQTRSSFISGPIS